MTTLTLTTQARRSSAVLTLSDLMDRGPIPAENVVRYASDIANELARLHNKGRAHGAVLPQNILFNEGIAELAAPPRTVDNGSLSADVVRFGAMLHAMVAALPKDEKVELRTALEKILQQHLEPEKGGAMPSIVKAAVALKLLRLGLGDAAAAARPPAETTRQSGRQSGSEPVSARLDGRTFSLPRLRRGQDLDLTVPLGIATIAVVGAGAVAAVIAAMVHWLR